MVWLHSPRTGREVRLVSRPVGRPTAAIFEIATVDRQSPVEGEVLVENMLMSVDPYMRGRLDDRPSYVPPFKIGESLDGPAIGRVLVSHSPALHEGDIVSHGFGWREFVTARAGKFTKFDPGHAPLQSYLGVLGLTGLTAYVGLLDIGELKDGNTVFVSAAAGAVGSIVCQIARIRNCTVIGSAGSPEKLDWLQSVAGVNAAFNYKTTDNPGRTLRELAPNGIDVYFDNVGGTQLEAALAAMNPRGHVVMCGMIGQYNATEPPCSPRNLVLAVGKRLTMRGFIVTDHEDRRAAFLADMIPWLAEGRIHAEETIFEGIESAPSAFMGLLAGENTGKMLVRLSSTERGS
jgi:NADPH-dependent curcumin reductase CurA